jgi:hypothetical protein
MKYPKAGDLQRKLGVELTENPVDNPWEVRSDSGLEGVYADHDDANFYADELRGSGARNVIVARRRKATRPMPPPRYPVRQNPPPTPEEWQAQVEREDQERRARLERTGPTPEQLYDRFHADRAAGIHHGERRGAALQRRNPFDRLFAGIYPTGIVYADRAREVDGDYLRVAFLPFSTLQLEWAPGTHPIELREAVERDAADVIAQRGQQFQVSTAGQTVILGKSNPAGLTAKGERMYEHIKEGYGRDPRAAEIASRTVLDRASKIPGLKRNR